MRNRFFLTTFFVLIAVSIGTVFIHARFFKADRIRLIDQQVRATAAALVDSELNDLRIINFDAADDIISDELGESRFGKFFIIRNEKDEVIYRSLSAEGIAMSEIPRQPQWLRVDRKGKYIRVLNLSLPRVKDRTLQVGIVVDHDLIEFNYFSLASLMVFSTVLTIGFVVSWLVSFFLMRPIAQIESFLSSAVSAPASDLPRLPPEIMRNAGVHSKDEFLRLIFGLSGMIEKVNRNYRASRLWSYQMAHELKTPLTVMLLRAEKIERSGLQSGDVEWLKNEITRISETVQSFLSWAELENSSQQKHLFANKISKVIEVETARLAELYPSRIRVEGDSGATLLSNPQHLSQLVHNLLVNALEYSQDSAEVVVRISDDRISISDRGPGFSQDVLNRLGEPFNQGKQGTKKKTSQGLGLAWAKTITRLYGWSLNIESSDQGSTVTIQWLS